MIKKECIKNDTIYLQKEDKMRIIKDHIKYLYNIFRNTINDSILNNIKYNLNSNLYCNISISLLLEFHKFISSLSFKYNSLVFRYASFSVPNDKFKKNHVITATLVRQFVEEKQDVFVIVESLEKKRNNYLSLFLQNQLIQ